jgi:nucleosome binding factor SPN SPT16 subunit
MADVRNGDARGATGVQINLEYYGKRLKALYGHWKEHKRDVWGGADAIAVVTPPSSEDLRYLKSSALHLWLLGYEFPETVMVFMPGALHVVCSLKKASHLEELQKSSRMLTGVDIHLHVKERKEDGSKEMEEILEAVQSQSKSKPPTIGVLAREATEGALMERWAMCLADSGASQVDVAGGFSEVFAVKDEEEITNIRNAAHLSGQVLKGFVVPKLEVIIDEEKKITHAELMENTEEVIINPGKFLKLRPEDVDICYPPVFQSGGVFDLKPSAASNEDVLYFDAMGVIICAIGARFKSYCSNIARTIMIDADKLQQKAYIVLLKAHDAAIAALRPGNPVSAVYKAAYAVVESGGPEFLQHFTKNAGTGIGIEFRESGLTLNAKNERIIKAGMVFNVSLGFQNLTTESRNPKSRNFSLLLADTVIVTEKGSPEVPTSRCSKAFTDIAYSFEEEKEEEPQEERKPKPKLESNGSSELAGRMATLRSDNQEMTKEEVRRQHQAELARQKNEETARRLAAGGSGHGDGQGSAKSTNDITAYRNVDDIPSRELMIQVDQKNEAVLLPIYGSLVPFHIATIKSVSSQQDGGHSYIRIIFNVPGAGFGPNDMPSQKFPRAIYVKEVSFRSNDTRHSNQVVQLIKTLRRQVAQRESEKAERATLVVQERLQIGKGRPIRYGSLLFPRKMLRTRLQARTIGYSPFVNHFSVP